MVFEEGRSPRSPVTSANRNSWAGAVWNWRTQQTLPSKNIRIESQSLCFTSPRLVLLKCLINVGIECWITEYLLPRMLVFITIVSSFGNNDWIKANISLQKRSMCTTSKSSPDLSGNVNGRSWGLSSSAGSLLKTEVTWVTPCLWPRANLLHVFFSLPCCSVRDGCLSVKVEGNCPCLSGYQLPRSNVLCGELPDGFQINPTSLKK